jgi:hypothetical protein
LRGFVVLRRASERRKSDSVLPVTLALTLRQNLDFSLNREVERVRGVEKRSWEDKEE